MTTKPKASSVRHDPARIRALSDRVDQLVWSKQWNYDRFCEIYPEAHAAAGGFGNALHFLLERSPDEWFERFRSEHPVGLTAV